MSEATREMRALVAQPQMDVEDAIFGVGPCKIIPEFKHLEAQTAVFKSMSKEHPLADVNRFNKVTSFHFDTYVHSVLTVCRNSSLGVGIVHIHNVVLGVHMSQNVMLPRRPQGYFIPKIATTLQGLFKNH